MKKTIYSKIGLFLGILMLLQTIYILPVSAVQNTKAEKLVSIAQQEVGYLETINGDGTFTSKYGEWYGAAKSAWCAIFISWCADKADISINAIPQFASCSVGKSWFENKQLWKSKGEYTPQPGDLIFLNDCTHVGIVEKCENDIVYTIEGNACDVNGKNYGVRQRSYTVDSGKITGYGNPDYEIEKSFNGSASQKSPAYMLPDSQSATIWEVWKNDELNVLCRDGNYYLVKYPFLNSGQFVYAYVAKNAVLLNNQVPESKQFYNINAKGKTIDSTNLYHNPSNTPLLSNSGEDKKIRAILNKNSEVEILFKDNDYYFIKCKGKSGFVNKDDIVLTGGNETPSVNQTNIMGDITGDGEISLADVTLLQKYLSKVVLLSDYQLSVADVSGDHLVKTDDVLLIQRYLAKSISQFPSQKPSENIIEPQAIRIDNPNPNILENGQTIKLNATIYPEDTTDKTVTWTSTNPDIASVDQNGLVTTKAAGTVTINACTVNSSIKTAAVIRINQITSYLGNGNYCLKLKGTNSYLDHQGGRTNGTNIHLWDGDGNSNANQKIVLDRIDDNRYMLRSAVENKLLVDLNRGSSLSDPIEIGKNIDLWENNDWQAQEWLFTKTYDGYYIIRLNMFQNGAIEAGGTSNGSNIYLGTYNPNNDMQKWELVDTSAYTVPERTAWVYNTQEIGNVNVRSGPGTGYASIGGFNEGQQITVIGEINGEWYKVRGANRHDGSTIEGYTHKDYITFDYKVGPDNPAPNLYSNSYNKNSNPFAQSNLFGQCTWYAWGRAHEMTGRSLPCRENAKTWYSVARNAGYSVGSTPRKNSIAVWSKGTYGHVAYVEKVDGNNVTITESNWDRTTYDYQYNIESGIYYYSGYKTLTAGQMSSRFGTLLGYIYL